MSPNPLPPATGHLPAQQVLVYTPDGPLGGTFTCTVCRVQAWQPDLLMHTPGCPFRAAPAPSAPPAEPGEAPMTLE